MYAIIDIGSNTIRLSIYKVSNNGFVQVLNKKTMAGLIGYVDSNKIMSSSGKEVAIEVLSGYKTILDNIKIKKAYYFATASLRNIKNSKEIVTEIEKTVGITIDVISGEFEGIYDFIGATHYMEMKSGLLVDIGGGSTELVFFENKKVIKSISLAFGSLSMYTKHVEDILPTKKEIKEIKNEVELALRNLNIEGNYPIICGSGGAIRGARKLNKKMYNDNDNERMVSTKNIKSIIKLVSKDYKLAVSIILKALPERIHTIIPGLVILDTIIKEYGATDVNVSGYGVREGYLSSMLEKEGIINE